MTTSFSKAAALLLVIQSQQKSSCFGKANYYIGPPNPSPANPLIIPNDSSLEKKHPPGSIVTVSFPAHANKPHPHVSRPHPHPHIPALIRSASSSPSYGNGPCAIIHLLTQHNLITGLIHTSFLAAKK